MNNKENNIKERGGKQVPVEEGLFNIPQFSDEKVLLNGSQCNSCGRYYFPKVERCMLCTSEDIKDVKLGNKGKLYSYTSVNYPPPGGHYKGKIPYGLGLVHLDEGILIMARLTEHDTSKLHAGFRLELALESLFQNEDGDEIIGFVYKSC